MHAATEKRESLAGLMLPAALLVGFGLFGAAQLDLLPSGRAPAVTPPDTVVVEARTFQHRLPGDFQQHGAPVNGTVVEEAFGPVEVMRRQVTAGDYLRCVADGGCETPRPAVRSDDPALPATGISYNGATSYAEWLSEATGQTWRLPTVAEWIFIAGDRAVDHALEAETDTANPAERWLAQYEQEAGRAIRPEAIPQPGGAFGANRHGVEDLAGNIWEWTATCANRTTLEADGRVASVVESCGIRYLEGRHLTPMNVFVQDARGGGCSVGAPPDNLSFRLVRDPEPMEWLWDWLAL